MNRKIALGGGCHWCTEAVSQSLKGVTQVEQGYLASTDRNSYFSEGVLVSYQPDVIPLETLIEIHLLTHESTSNHSFRKKYRSAIYFLTPEDETASREALQALQKDFEEPLITQVLPFAAFEASRLSLHDYYFSNPEKPFCQRYSEPKIQMLLKNFSKQVDPKKFQSS